MKGFFVTGTDTEIGKTYVSCLILKYLVAAGYRAAGLKPIASGCSQTQDGLQNDDALALMSHANIELPYSLVNRYAFEPAIAPHIAAKQLAVDIDLDAIRKDALKASKDLDFLVVEGAGGWKVPLNANCDMADLALLLQLPVVVVVGIKLGCINHALLTIESIAKSGQPIAGWIANKVFPDTEVQQDIIESLQNLIDVPQISEISYEQQNLLPKFAFCE